MWVSMVCAHVGMLGVCAHVCFACRYTWYVCVYAHVDICVVLCLSVYDCVYAHEGIGVMCNVCVNV